MTSYTAAHAVAFEGLRPEFPVDCDSKYIPLAKKCWQENPDLRPSFSEVVTMLKAIKLAEESSKEEEEEE